ncbi:MAG: hypothetical protein ACOCNC_02620 [Acetivibrio ethanolgignens]
MIAGINMRGQVTGLYPQYNVNPISPIGKTEGTDAVEKSEKKGECQTCKNRKYVDGSNEGNVSFKTPGHISPEASGAVVMAHEKEHVANAVNEGNKANKELISATVSLQMAVCPECGRAYVAGGTTRTTMATYSDNPYDQARKSIEGSFLAGQNIDYVA